MGGDGSGPEYANPGHPLWGVTHMVVRPYIVSGTVKALLHMRLRPPNWGYIYMNLLADCANVDAFSCVLGGPGLGLHHLHDLSGQCDLW